MIKFGYLYFSMSVTCIVAQTLAQDLPLIDPVKAQTLKRAEEVITHQDRKRLRIQNALTSDQEDRIAASISARERSLASHPYTTVFDRKIGLDVLPSSTLDIIKVPGGKGYKLLSREMVLDPEVSCLSEYCGVTYSVIRSIGHDGSFGEAHAKAGAYSRYAPDATVLSIASKVQKGIMLQDNSALLYAGEYKSEMPSQWVAHIYRMDNLGRILFHQQFPSDSRDDSFTKVKDMVELADGTFVIVFADRSNGKVVMLLRLSANGELISKKYIGSRSSHASVLALSDGGYLYTGHEIIKYSTNGQEIWSKEQTGHRALELSGSQGLIIASINNEGSSFKSNSRSGLKSIRIVLNAFTSEGGHIWETDGLELLGNVANIADMALLPDGGIVIFGTLTSSLGNSAVGHDFGQHWFLACANADGSTRWVRRVPTLNAFSQAAAILVEDDGSLFLAGESDGRTGDNPVYSMPDGSKPAPLFIGDPSVRLTKLEPTR